MGSDLLPDVSLNEVQTKAMNIYDTQQLVDLYVQVHNKYLYIKDEVYDYEEGTEEYNNVCLEVDSWAKVMDDLEEKITFCAKHEGFCISDEKIWISGWQL